jgi:Ca2+-binding EF-hand superfamily protein
MAERVPLTEGQLEQIEFSLRSLATGWDESQVSIVFDLLDRDGNGTISSTELRTVMVQIEGVEFGEKTAKDWIQEADTNGDGVIQLTEFFEFIRKNVS